MRRPTRFSTRAFAITGSQVVLAALAVALLLPGLAGSQAPTPDAKALRGITAVRLGGTGRPIGSPYPVYPACYPGSLTARDDVAMGELLQAAGDVLNAGVIEQSSCVGTNYLEIDAQIRDHAAHCVATVTLQLHRDRGEKVLWRRTFEITGAPAGFAARVSSRLKLDVSDLVRDIALANAPKPGTPTTGRMAIAPQFDRADAFAEGFAVVQRPEWAGKQGYINTHGAVVIKPQFAEARAFSGGLAAVRDAGSATSKWGYIGTHGRMAIAPQFAWAGPFRDGLASVQIDAGTGKRGYIDRLGTMVITPQFDSALEFGNGLAAVRVGDAGTGRWGYIDRQGRMVITPQFDSAGTFSDGLAPVREGNDVKGKWGYIDRGAAVVIRPQFALVKSFSDGFAAIRVGGSATDKWGYIDRQGKIVIKPRFYFAGSFSDGLAEVSETREWTYIREPGNAAPTQVGQADPFIGVAAVTDIKASRWAYINTQGRKVLPAQFGQAGAFSDGLAPVRVVHERCRLERWGYIRR